jgi:hypothetical protein
MAVSAFKALQQLTCLILVLHTVRAGGALQWRHAQRMAGVYMNIELAFNAGRA